MNHFHPRAAERTPDGMKFGLVTFVDILGFSAASKTYRHEDIQSILRSRKTVRSSALAGIGATGLNRDFVMFQDTMVRCVEIGFMPPGLSDDEETHHLGNWLCAVMDELASLRELQLAFIARGLPLRGAIAVGPYDTAEDVVWGPAYEHSAGLESTVAVYPRIILDEYLQGFLDYVWKADHQWIIENVRFDDENIPYIDYLNGIAFECPGNLSSFESQLIMHQRFIEQGLRHHQNAAVLEKFIWLSNYHNTVVLELEQKRPEALDWKNYQCQQL